VTVLDTSAVVDFLLGSGAAADVESLLARGGSASAPDVLVFEVLAVLRRDVLRGTLSVARAEGAVDDLGDMPIDYYPSLWLRRRAWELRDTMTAADALFVGLAQHLDEPLATRDGGLARAAASQHGVQTIALEPGSR
jgi:predicted nucleic acid-binding protein